MQNKPVGFGHQLKPPYRCTISTYSGGFGNFKFLADSQGEAIAKVSALLLVLANPDESTYWERAELEGFTVDHIEAIAELGTELGAIDAPPSPKFLQRVAMRMASSGDEKLSRRESLKRAAEYQQKLRRNHWLATLYTPQGKGLKQFSNLMELEGEGSWRAIAWSEALYGRVNKTAIGNRLKKIKGDGN
jgi:hypothetical protein